MPAPKLVPLAEAARRLGVAHGTLTIQARRGKLKAKKLGRDWFVTEAEADRYARENRRGVGDGGVLSPASIAAAFDVSAASVTADGPDYAAHRDAKAERAAFVADTFGAPMPAPKPKRRGA